MFRYIVRRLLGAVVVVFIVSLVTFFLFQLGPKITGSSPAYLYAGKNPTPEIIAQIEKGLGLDQPLLVQYGQFVKGIVVGREYSDGTVDGVRPCPAPCFGYSFRYQTPVWDLIKDRFPVTASLAVGAAILWLIFGLSVGILSALKKGTITDRVAMIIALAGVSLPVYFTGLVLLYVFVYGPIRFLPPPSYKPLTEDPVAWLQSLILPWVALAFLYAALYARLTRANMLDTMSEDYIRTAVSKGLSRRKVISKHALRAALTPIITIFGLDLGALLGGAILTEKVFSLPGLGYLSIDAIQKQDLPVIMGVTIVAALFIVVANIVVDVLYGVVDPRVRLS
ncbi:ABC transporter permease [Longivirga aurantiaca]|uniref:ABC transporter permease n=1 Tax=Longivirga aurantiaca TaxID=1837743 RepID=A0ABW1SZH6_9ACTN